MDNIQLTEKFENGLLTEYINVFYGYGNWNSNFWFIGIEEGGGGSFEEVKKRLDSWNNFIKKDLIDIQEHHVNIELEVFFTTGKLQSTWRKLILTKLSFEEKSTDKPSVVEIQKGDWGHKNSSNLLIELFPLPSPNNVDWFYKNWTDIPYLKKDRKDYYEEIAPKRVSHIKDQINSFQPRIVLFYGKKMESYWIDIIGTKQLKEILIGKHKVKYSNSGNTCYIISPHPASIYSNDFWIQLGVMIREFSY